MRTALLTLSLLLAGPALAQSPSDALGAGPRRIYEEGRALEAAGQLADAAVRYRTVLELEPGWVQAVADLGRVLEEAGDLDGAEAVYRRAPWDPDAVEALGHLLLGQDRHEEAAALFARLRDLRPDTPEFLVYEADAVGRADPPAGVAIFEEYLDFPRSRAREAPALDVCGRLAEALWAAEQRADEPAAAGSTRAFVDLVAQRLAAEGAPEEGPELERIDRLMDRFAVEDEADRLSRAADRPLDEAGLAILERALAELRTNRAADSARQLGALVESHPDSAAAWGALAEAQLAAGQLAAAEVAAMRAEQLDPLDPAHSARLGDLLLDHSGGRADREAAAAYARALARPGASPDLWYRRAQAERRSGQLGAAAASFEHYLLASPDAERAAEARGFVEGWQRERPEPPPPLPELERPGDVSADSWRRYWISVVLSRPPRGTTEELERALAELQPVREESPDWVRAMNLEAAIRLRRGEAELAVALYQRSLELDPRQGAVLLVLADLERERGGVESAEVLEDRAAVLGEPVAHLRLGLRAQAQWKLLLAREHLEAYLASPGRDRGSERDRAAVAAAAQVEGRLQGLMGATGVLVLGLVALPIAVRTRRRGGVSLRELLDASPAAWPEVARILSAIRHEVLKHHTTVLPAVAEALDVGDPALGAWAADRLCGPRGALTRFGAYVAELELLGRVHGLRLNLRHRDPVLGPLIVALEELAALEDDLRAGRQRAVEPLRQLATRLNHTAYRALGAQLRQLCLLPLDRSLIDEVWAAVCEEQRAELELEVDLPEEQVLLRIFRAELDDILTNLLRNALEAAAEGEVPRVGLAVRTEEDEITGLERVLLRVQDNATRRISTAMIRGRYIGRGLGLAVDLISRNGGSVHVEPEPGWEKAVVIRLPRAEAPDLEDE